MKAVLIYPKFPDTFWSLKHALKFVGKHAYTPPLGLMTIAPLLEKHFELRLVDLNVRPLRRSDLAWADYAFISAMQVQEESARQIIARCNASGVKVVAGGPLFTHDHERFDGVNHFVLNEAEVVLPQFLADLKEGRAGRLYTTDRFAELRESPVPRFDLSSMKHYVSMCVQYSRGCPFNCEFCDVTALFGRRPRVKPVEHVIAELNRLKELGWRGQVFFVDDNIVGNRRDVKHQLLPALIEWQRTNGPMTFCSQASIDLADDPELIDQLSRAGFTTLFIGIETPDTDALMACKKGQNINRDMLADIHRIQSAGIEVQGGFIVGFDNESPSIFRRQINFIQSSGIVSAMVGILQAISGTRLYQRLREEGRLLSVATGNNVADVTNFITTMDAQTLRDGYAYLLKNLYAPKTYYRRLRVFLSRYQRPKVRLPIDRHQIQAFCRSVVRLGILGRERLQYWRLLFWTLLHRPKALNTAVTLAILGHHYRRICQKYFRGERSALSASED